MTKNTAKGPGSFCVPRTAIEALLDARATALEICAYLALARYTDDSGCYSSASVNAVYKATGASKLKGGTIERAIARLKTIQARDVGYCFSSDPSASPASASSGRDLGPILFDREGWQKSTGELLPDGPISKAQIRHVLPELDELMGHRVWFGNNLASGVGEFPQPLRALKNAGDAAARLLIALYAANDMEAWGGVPPDRGHPWRHFAPAAEEVRLPGGARLVRAKDAGVAARIDKRIGESAEEYWSAVHALEAAGFIYPVIMVLNRNAVQRVFSSGERFCGVSDDAEPLYELDARSAHGYKPRGEEGLAGATGKTAGELGYSVADLKGSFNGTYAAFLPTGFQGMVAGIYRLRFRVANARNVGVQGTWARIHQSNREAFAALNTIRKQSNLEPLASPWQTANADSAVHQSPSGSGRTLQCVQ